MGVELLRLPQEGDEVKPSPPLSYTEIFEKQFPHYLAIGMTPDEYWNGDSNLVKAYREADKLRFDRRNFEAWLQGKYFYDALCMSAPMFNSLKPHEPYPYHDEPIKFARNEKEMDEIKVEKEQKADKAEQDKIRQMILNIKKPKKKDGEDSG